MSKCLNCEHDFGTDLRGRCIAALRDAGGSMVYCGCECVFPTARPPVTPSDAAMRAAEEIVTAAFDEEFGVGGWVKSRLETDLIQRITRHLAGASDKENPVSTVTFGDSKNIANPDVSCPRCGGTKPTCCSCPEPKQFSLPEFAREFTQAAINAHVGFKHETRWHDCNYASCAKWREMIDTLNAAATTSPEIPDSETEGNL